MLALLQRFRSNKKAGMATVTALMMPVLIGSAGMTSDAIQMTFIKRVMQRQADSAAIAGAFALSQGRAPAASAWLSAGFWLGDAGSAGPPVKAHRRQY